MTAEHIRLDFDRVTRIGFDEAILCAGKSVAHLSAILEQAQARRISLLLTRLDEGHFRALPERLRAHLDYDPLSRTGIVGSPSPPLRPAVGQVAVLTAGTSDIGVGREVVRTLTYYGVGCIEFADVGVAGLWRVLDVLDALRKSPVVIAVAGMDAALPSVVGGLVPGAVIAVPTSVGYGVAAGGTTALHAALASCAPGITVVNIDNGFGAACAAVRIINALAAADTLARCDLPDAVPCPSASSGPMHREIT